MEQFEEKVTHKSDLSEESSSDPEIQLSTSQEQLIACDQTIIDPETGPQACQSSSNSSTKKTASKKLSVGAKVLACTAGFSCGMLITKYVAEVYIGQMVLLSSFGLAGALIFTALLLPLSAIFLLVFFLNIISRELSPKKKSLFFKAGDTKRELQLFLLALVTSAAFPATFWFYYGDELTWLKNVQPDDWMKSDPEENEKKAAELALTAPQRHKGEAQVRYAQTLLLNEKDDLAKQEYQKAIAIVKDDPDNFQLYADALSKLASIAQRQKHFDRAIETEKEVIKLLELHHAFEEDFSLDRLNTPFFARKGPTYGFNNETVAGSTIDLANIYFGQKNYAEAEANFKNGIKMAIETKSIYINTMNYVYSFASYLKEVKREAEIKPLYDTTIGAILKYADNSRSIYESAGEDLQRLGLYDLAIEYSKKSLTYPKAEFGTPGEIHQNLGLCYLKQGKYELAHKEFAEQLQIAESEVKADPERAYKKCAVFENFARLCKAQGNFDKADDYLKKSLSISTADRDGPSVRTLLRLASLNILWNKNDIAEKYYKDAISLREKQTGAFSRFNLAKVLYEYSKFLKKTARTKEAEAIDQRIKTLIPAAEIASMREWPDVDEER